MDNPHKKEPWTKGRIIKTGAIVLVVGALIILKFGWAAVTSVDNSAVDTNNSGLEAFDSGDAQNAISQFRSAADSAITNTNKIGALKNLAYTYETEGRYDEAHGAYQEALALTSEDSFDYYLISGEIAVLEGKHNAALLSYNKAYEKNPNDFQINNSLAIFYLDLEDLAPQYANYSKALSHAQSAYELDAEKLETTKQNLAIAHFFNENYDQSISLLSTSNLVQHPYAGFWLGLAYVSNGDDANGCFYLQQAVDAGVEAPQEVYDYLYSC